MKGPVAFAQVGVHTDFPDASSAMDIYAPDKGLLIPRVVLSSSLTSPSPVTSPATGLLVFNTGANQPVGFYYWDGSIWVSLSGGSASGEYWSLYGNSGTTVTVNFVGTTDSKDLAFRTNNQERMRLEMDGQVIIGGTVPQAATHVFTVYGNTSQNFAIAAFSPTVGFYNLGGRYGVFSQVDTACNPNPGFAVWAKNTDVSSYGIYAVGSNVSSLPLITSHTAGITSYGFDGLHAWGRNTTTGHGICAIGSGQNSSFALANVSAGVSAVGKYGIIARGTDASGRGIVAIGSGEASPSTSSESEGGAFTGYHGVYGNGKGVGGGTPARPLGIGVIGVGYNVPSYSGLLDKSLGGSFSGDYGVYGKGLNATDGIGVLGVGSGGSGYYTLTNGSGGALTGYHGLLSVGSNVAAGMGVVGAGNNSAYSILPTGGGGVFTAINTGAAGFATSPTGGIGIIGAGNNQAASLPTGGGGGAFAGNIGVLATSVLANGTGIIGLGNAITSPGTFADGAGGTFTGLSAGAVGWGATAATGTGVIGVGNNIATPLTYGSGGGGAFTGTEAGVVGWGTTAATGIGVIGVGNNTTTSIPSTGCGGAFTGTVCGVYGYATNTSNSNRYGGYFETSGAYAYVGVRYNNTNRKILGTNSVSTIVKNTKGELVILTCPEAPETVFQDFGIGQLVNGQAHITIDPDLAININVNEAHPLKVYITPEGDCNGVYVTNKTINGFDVIELMGGTSNVSFAWQIVATRADEEYTLKDGRVEVAVNSQRFPPAPGPLEMTEQPATINQMTILETVKLEKVMSGQESMKTTETFNENILEVKEDEVIENGDKLDE